LADYADYIIRSLYCSQSQVLLLNEEMTHVLALQSLLTTVAVLGITVWGMAAVLDGEGHWTGTTTSLLLWTILQYHCVRKNKKNTK